MSIYYSPEQFDLEVVGEVQKVLYYEFDILVVWRDGRGKLWYAQDAGCSCPAPFEHTGLGDLSPLTTRTLRIFERVLGDYPGRDRLRRKVENILYRIGVRGDASPIAHGEGEMTSYGG